MTSLLHATLGPHRAASDSLSTHHSTIDGIKSVHYSGIPGSSSLRVLSLTERDHSRVPEWWSPAPSDSPEHDAEQHQGDDADDS